MKFRRRETRAPSPVYRYASRLILLASLCVAASWYLQRELRPPPASNGSAGDLDLSPSAFPDVGQDVVLTNPRNKNPLPEDGSFRAEEALGLDRQMLFRVLDKTKGIPERPYFHLVDIASRTSADELLEHAQGEDQVTYAHLWTQPEKHRGQLIYLKGHLRGLSRIEVTENPTLNPSGLKSLYQGDLFTTAASPRPYILVMPKIPQGMPAGLNISENITFVGFFLKQWRYKTAGDVDRAAPLLIGRLVHWQPSQAQGLSSPFRTYLGWGIVLAVSLLGAVVWLVRRIVVRRRGATPPQVVPGFAATTPDLDALKSFDLPNSLSALEDLPDDLKANTRHD